MTTHAEHAVKSYKFSNFLKQIKNDQRVKIFKNCVGNLQMGSKETTGFFFLFDLAFKTFLAQAQHALTENFLREKTLKS
jgi:hypothetical protein